MLGISAVILSLLSARVFADDCQLNVLIPESDLGTCAASTDCKGIECTADLAGINFSALNGMALISVTSGNVAVNLETDSCTGKVAVDFNADTFSLLANNDPVATNENSTGRVEVTCPSGDTTEPLVQYIPLITKDAITGVPAGAYLLAKTEKNGNTVSYDHSIQFCYKLGATSPTTCGDPDQPPYYDFAVLKGSFTKLDNCAGVTTRQSFSLAEHAGLQVEAGTVPEGTPAPTTNAGTEVPDSESGLGISLAVLALGSTVCSFF